MPAHLVERNVAAHQTSQAVDEGRQRDGPRCVEVAKHFRPGATEVKHGAALPTVGEGGEAISDEGAMPRRPTPQPGSGSQT